MYIISVLSILLKGVYVEAKVSLVSAKLSYSNQLVIRQVLGYALAGAEALLNHTSGSASSTTC